MDWQPITREALDRLMQEALDEAGDIPRAAWQRLRIEPQKWQCPSTREGDAGGGFWVVGRIGDRVIWFNDVEDGFNLSASTTSGIIDAYWCNQATFADILRDLPESRRAEEFAADAPTTIVPADARGSGRVERRQTTYWDVRPDSGGAIRIHFSDAAETQVAGDAYDDIDIADTHPLLRDYDEPWL